MEESEFRPPYFFESTKKFNFDNSCYEEQAQIKADINLHQATVDFIDSLEK